MGQPKRSNCQDMHTSISFSRKKGGLLCPVCVSLGGETRASGSPSSPALLSDMMPVFFTFPFASPSSRWAGLSRDCVPPYTKPGRSSRWHGFDCTQERASQDHDRRRVRFGGASAQKKAQKWLSLGVLC